MGREIACASFGNVGSESTSGARRHVHAFDARFNDNDCHCIRKTRLILSRYIGNTIHSTVLHFSKYFFDEECEPSMR